jgi:hypothetical protein
MQFKLIEVLCAKVTIPVSCGRGRVLRNKRHHQQGKIQHQKSGTT